MDVKYIKIIMGLYTIIICTVISFGAESFYNTAEEIGDSLIENMPYEMERSFYELSGGKPRFSEILKLKPNDLINLSLNYLSKGFKAPLKIIAEAIIAAALLGAAKNITPCLSEKEGGMVFKMIAVLCISGILFSPVINSIKTGIKAAEDANTFIAMLIPTISAVMLSLGMPTTASAYSLGVIAICNMVSGLLCKIALPFLKLYLALGFSGAVSGRKEITAVGNSIKSFIAWFLGFIMFLFTGFLSLQSFVGTATDNLATKTAKMAISGFVPIIGSAVSGAFNMAESCLKIIKSSLGIVGIAIVVISLLHPVLNAVLWYCTCKMSLFVFEMLGVSEMGEFIKICSEAMKFVLSLLIAYGVMVIISLGTAVFIGAGG